MKDNNFFNSLKGKKIGIIGLGVSHYTLIEFLLHKQLDVTVLDKREKEAIGSDYHNLSALGAKFIVGSGYASHFIDFDIIFRTPGMYYLSESLQYAKSCGVVVTSEMEVFFDLCPCKIYAVTGSDGKTTTTTLIGEMLHRTGKKVHVGGNIGRALLPIIEEIEEDDVCVVELSSFQLISMRCSPQVSVITNISPNHLDVHRDMEEYINAKMNILLHQNAFSRTVLNLDNEVAARLYNKVRGRLVFFSRSQIPQTGAFLDADDYLCYNDKGKISKIMHKSEIFLPGMHNVENYLAAISAVKDDNVSDDDIIAVAKNFGGVEHRIEYVKTVDGVQYYNDSIATSPTRTIAGLNSFEKKLIIIAGGYDKNIPYDSLGPVLCDRVKTLILLGATADKIEKSARESEGFAESGLEIIRVESLEEAVETARNSAKPGDIVSLSPASASFDLYKNFEERGRHFKRLVRAL